MPRPGDRVWLTRSASPQFGQRPIGFRVVREVHSPTAQRGWTWLAGYELDEKGEATHLRTLFVQLTGLRYID